jgi:hypothetical protein
MSNYLEKKQFKKIDINDTFFESLINDYPGFKDWFKRKVNEEAYIQINKGNLEGFLYLKYENGPITDVTPHIECEKALKIGTLKIVPHGTRLGERFIKKALDFAVIGKVDLCYVTIFEKHKALVKLFEKYGFARNGYEKGDELVLVKSMKDIKNDILLDYPLINTKHKEKFLLSIYPEYHSIMFPDSILNNESVDILEDVTITNSIHKTYVTNMRVKKAKPGDIFVMYRTGTMGKPAEYTAVATSVCVVEEVRSQYEFKDFNEFYKYITTYSILDRNQIQSYYNKQATTYAVKMTYNAALSKRLIRQKLADNIGLNRKTRWSFIRLTDEQFFSIIEEGGVSESLIID